MCPIVCLCGILDDTVARAQGFTEVGGSVGFTLPQRMNAGPRICGLNPYDCLVDYTGGVAVGDIDQDGLVDVVFSRPDAPMLVYRGLPGGAFDDISGTMGLGLVTGASGVALADVDGDGALDLLVTTIGSETGRLFLNRYPQPFDDQRPTAALFDFYTPHPSSGFGLAVGDYDRDGALDVFTSHWGGRFKECGEPRSRLYRGDRSTPAWLVDVTEAAAPQVLDLDRVTWVSYGSGFADFDDNGWPDLLVTGDFGKTQLFWNDAGRFTRAEPGIGEGRFGMGSTVADFDGDGYLDVFMTGVSPEILQTRGHGLFLYRGARTFLDATEDAGVVTGGWGWGTAGIDYDHDGDMDIVATTGDDFDGPLDDPMIFYRNNGDGTFTEVAQSLGLVDTEPGRGLALLDYDRDGDQDILIVRSGGTPLLYRNDAGVALGDYLRVRARGTRGNSEGLGARVEVQVEGRTWVAEISSTTHFVGQSERVAHIGVGRGATPRTARVRVRFLGGHEVIVEDVALNQEIVVEEPDLPFPEAPAPPPGAPPDCDMNGTPDYCAPDCDENGSPDACDVASGRAADCNGNGAIDACEIASGFERDCDGDLVLDTCQIAADPALDCDTDGWLDSCVTPNCGSSDAGLTGDAGGSLDTGLTPMDMGPTAMDSGPEQRDARPADSDAGAGGDGGRRDIGQSGGLRGSGCRAAVGADAFTWMWVGAVTVLLVQRRRAR